MIPPGVTHAALLALIVTGLGLVVCGRSDNSASRAKSNTRTAIVAADSLVIELTGRDSATVLELTATAHRVDYIATALGAFVKAIDGTASGPRGFWVYSVNDSLPEIACDRYTTHSGDRVKWRFRRMTH